MVKENREIKEAELNAKLALVQNQGATVGMVNTALQKSAQTELKSLRNNYQNSSQEALYNAVMKGNRNGIVDITNKAIEAGEDASELLNEVLLPAINAVGDLFDKGKYFLPQLIASAEAMKLSIERLEPLLKKDSEAEEMPVVVIATVEGDIHDIGKNLVALMLKNHGFQVID